jgi:hypothetical protein
VFVESTFIVGVDHKHGVQPRSLVVEHFSTRAFATTHFRCHHGRRHSAPSAVVSL